MPTSEPLTVFQLTTDLAGLHRALTAALVPSSGRNDGTGRRTVPGSKPPLMLDPDAVMWAIETGALLLARSARRELGHARRDATWPQALQALPLLYEALPDGHPLVRSIPRTLEGLRRKARTTLGLDAKLIQLGKCPSVREPYAATWDISADGAVWEVTAEWTDGLCRIYDPAHSKPDRDRPLDAWRRSHVVVDPSADTDSIDGDIRCPAPGCRRRWHGEQGRRDLAKLMEPPKLVSA